MTTSMIAAVAPPGIPSTSSGTSVPEVTPLLALSGAIRPSGCPVPYSSGVFETDLDC